MKNWIIYTFLLLTTVLNGQQKEDNHQNRPNYEKQLSYVTFPTLYGAGSGIRGDDYEVAIRLTKAELGECYGKYITQVWFVVDGGWNSGGEVNIYKGTKTDRMEPEQLVCTVNIDTLVQTQMYWVAKLPANTVKIEPGYDYWASYKINAKIGKALRLDCGPAAQGKGQWLKYRGVWKELSEYKNSMTPFTYDNTHCNWMMKVIADGFHATDKEAPEINTLDGTIWFGGYDMKLEMVVLDASTVPQQMDAVLTLVNGTTVPVTFKKTSDTWIKRYRAVLPVQAVGAEGTIKVNLRDTRNNVKWSDEYPVKWITPKTMLTESFDDLNTPNINPEWKVIYVRPANPTWGSNRVGSGFCFAGHTGKNCMSTQSTLMDKNEWLIAPPIEMISGQKYKLRFWYRGYNSQYKEKMAVRLGTDYAIDSMYIDTLFVNENISGGPYKKVEKIYECKKTGLYHLGFWCYSTGGINDVLFLDDVELFNDTSTELTKITELTGTHGFAGESLKIFFVASNISSLSVVSSQYKIDGQSDFIDFNLAGMKNSYYLSGLIPAQGNPAKGTMRIIFKDQLGNTQTVEEPIYWHKKDDVEKFDFNVLDQWPEGWQTWDKDGDGDNWRFIEELPGINQTVGISSPSRTIGAIPLNPDNYLVINPRKILPGAAIKYNIASQYKMFTESYGIGVSTTGPKGEYDMIFSEKLPFVATPDEYQGYWFERTVSLEKYAGQEVWIAFRHYQSPCGFVLTIDDVTLFNTQSVVGIEEETEKKNVLVSCYPNPFNPVTTLKFTLPAESQTSLRVYNAKGEIVTQIVNEKLTAGTYSYAFNGTGLNSGVYFYRLESAGMVKTGKMLMIK